MQHRTTVEFIFSPGSRYSYLAASQVPALEKATGCTVEWIPVNGTRLRALVGRDPFAGEPVSGQYDWGYRRRDAERWADYYGIPFREPPTRHFDFDLLARAATAARRMGAAASYGWRLCMVVYGSDTWPVDEAACVRTAEEVGLPGQRFAAVLAEVETGELLAAAAADAYRRGAFGVPTFLVTDENGGHELFWGNDRIVLLRHALLTRFARAPGAPAEGEPG